MTETQLKYEVLKTEEHEHPVHKGYYRIRSLRNTDRPYRFGQYSGQMGGYVHGETPGLSQDGHCWVYDEAIVMYGGQVRGNGRIHHHAQVLQGGFVQQDGVASDYSVVGAGGYVNGNSQIYGSAEIYHFEMMGVDRIGDTAYICNRRDIMRIGPIGSEDRTLYMWRSHKGQRYEVRAGCWIGDINALRARVQPQGGNGWYNDGGAANTFSREYLAACDLMEARVLEWKLRGDITATAIKPDTVKIG